MRAVAAFGHARPEDGTETAARTCFNRLLVTDPNDNQGIRHLVQEVDGETTMPVP